MANNSGEVSLHQSWGGETLLHGRQIAFPKDGQNVSQMTGHPKLSVGDVNELPPVLFMLDIGCLEIGQEQFLFAKAEEVFLVETTGIGLLDVQQGQFVATLPHDDQPERMFEDWLALFIVTHDAHQRERMFVHGHVFADHQQVMPRLYLYLIDFAATTPFRQGPGFIRLAPGCRVSQRESLCISSGMTCAWIRLLLLCRLTLTLENAGRSCTG